MTRAYPDQRVAWLWEDGWTLVRAITTRERDRLLLEFDRDSSGEWRPQFTEPRTLGSPGVLGFPLFLFDECHRGRAVVAVDSELQFTYWTPQASVGAQESVHFISMFSDLGVPFSVELMRESAWGASYCPGRCPDPACEADVLLGDLPHLFTCPTAELS